MDDLAALLAKLEAEHSKLQPPKPARKMWRSGLEARQAEERDEPEFPQELQAVERGEFLQYYTTEEVCAWINRLCAETRQAIARTDALIERTG